MADIHIPNCTLSVADDSLGDIIIPKSVSPLLGMRRGDNKTLVGVIRDSGGNPVDITGYTIKFSMIKSSADLFTMNKTMEAVDYVIQKTTAIATEVNITDAAAGEYKIYLLPADTQEENIDMYWCDVEVTTTDATPEVYTVNFEEFEVFGDITRPTP